jgi:cysteine-rich CWC protein
MSDSAQIIGDQRPLTCARCGAAFACGADTGACWCGEEDFRLPMPAADSGEDCLCPACLRKAAASSVVIIRASG